MPISDEEWAEIEIKARCTVINGKRVWIASVYRLGMCEATARAHWASEAVNGVLYQYMNPPKARGKRTS